MPATNHDPHNLGELARAITIAARIQRRKAKGKGTAHLEKRFDEIREKAQAREDARRNK
ncbi:hypothetical protein [Streptomyces sp. NPDC007904]|uniref:hypothetical protein n=1 Tax=Streptomyces sp. NPDC007904 TaxID=3364787 RepID=UPI0036E7B69A